jgi:alkanesulfonate monooxygenase SsuD/methylene tetrahydromethanopterin reductase-like flavin-dependent oxidoreductase (luciferase family)
VTFRAVVTRSAAETARRKAEELADLPKYQLEQYISFGTVDQCVERLIPYAERGVRDFLLAVKAPIDWTTVDLIATEVAPRLRECVGDVEHEPVEDSAPPVQGPSHVP